MVLQMSGPQTEQKQNTQLRHHNWA